MFLDVKKNAKTTMNVKLLIKKIFEKKNFLFYEVLNLDTF